MNISHFTCRNPQYCINRILMTVVTIYKLMKMMGKKLSVLMILIKDLKSIKDKLVKSFENPTY